MTLFLILGCVLVYMELAALVAPLLDKFAVWHRKTDPWSSHGQR